MAEPSISVNTQSTRQEQIAQAVQRVGTEPLRVRVQALLYDGPPTRGYTSLRDAAWSMAVDNPNVEFLEQIVNALEMAVTAISTLGPNEVLRRLAETPVDASAVDPTPDIA